MTQKTTGKGSFGGKRNTNGFDKNPQNGNKKGRPRKGIALVNEQMKDKGYEPATKQDIEATYLFVVNLSEAELVEITKDKEQPMLVRILARNLLSAKGFDIAEKMFDRSL